MLHLWSPSEHAMCPEAPTKPPFGASFGLTFGECHVSRVIDRESIPGKVAREPPVPSAEAKITPPDVVRERHASRSPHREPNREIPRPPSGSFPKETRVPECLSRKTPSRTFSEPATCPETPLTGFSPGDRPSTP